MNSSEKSELITSVDFGEVLGEKYLAYALSTIMSRSLPDVRDGLKPVHRRLLYAMQQLRLRPEEAFKKCARVVGDVIGKYHPHGDVAVYETLVRLAQDFSLRYPLIDGQGNFGSVDGDNAAAMRYTESRLTEIAMRLMEDLDKDTINFKPTYDDSELEPSLMPAGFPNLLANGAEGIAVGMATSIPPHNLEELCKASAYLIDNREALVEELATIIECPDFPTGGIIVDHKSNLLSIYKSGRGSIRIRARWEIENFAHGLYQIVITEIPYQIQKSRLIEQVADLLKDKKLPFVTNIRDESAEDIRIIIEPKNRTCDAKSVMESLFKTTALESRFNYNLNVLNSKGLPELMSIKRVLEEFIEHRFVIVTRRSIFERNKIDARLEILAGMRIVYLNLDEIIQIIRDEDEPKPALIKRFLLTENQAEAILNTKLRSLRKLEEEAIKIENDVLSKRRAELCEILEDKKKCWKLVKKELAAIEKQFAKTTKLGARRTSFIEYDNQEVEMEIEALIEKEPITIIISKQGWLRSIKGSVDDISSLKFKEGDDFSIMLKAYTTDYILIATKLGKFYTIFADNISKGKGHGEPMRMMFDLADDDEMISIFIYNPASNIFLASSAGKGFVVSELDVFAQTKLGKQIMNLSDNEVCIKAIEMREGFDMIASTSSARKLLIFELTEMPVLKRGQGVAIMKMKEGRLQDLQIFAKEEGFKWSNGREIKVQKNISSWLGKRAGAGKLPPFGFFKNNNFGI